MVLTCKYLIAIKIVPPNQSKMMYEAAKENGYPVAYKLFEGTVMSLFQIILTNTIYLLVDCSGLGNIIRDKCSFEITDG